MTITSSPLIAITRTHWSRERAPTPAWPSFSARKPAARADSAARCIFSIARITCTADTPSSARMCRSPWEWLSRQISREDRVTLCFFGDGAINQGAFHEALNLAGALQAADRFHLREQSFRHGHVGETIDLAQANRRSRRRLRYSGRNCRWDELSRSARQTCARSSLRSGRIRIRLSLKRALIVIAVIPCPIRRVIGPKRSWKNIGWTIRSRGCAPSSRAKAN